MMYHAFPIALRTPCVFHAFAPQASRRGGRCSAGDSQRTHLVQDGGAEMSMTAAVQELIVTPMVTLETIP